MQLINKLIYASGARTLSDLSPCMPGSPRPCWLGKLIPEVSSAHMVSITSFPAELTGSGTDLCSRTQPGPDQEHQNAHVVSSNFIVSSLFSFILRQKSKKRFTTDQSRTDWSHWCRRVVKDAISGVRVIKLPAFFPPEFRRNFRIRIQIFSRGEKEGERGRRRAGFSFPRFSQLKFSRILRRGEAASPLRSNTPGECGSNESLLMRASTSHLSVQLPPPPLPRSGEAARQARESGVRFLREEKDTVANGEPPSLLRLLFSFPLGSEVLFGLVFTALLCKHDFCRMGMGSLADRFLPFHCFSLSSILCGREQ